LIAFIGACGVHKKKGGTDLVINGIPFGDDHSIDATSLTHTPHARKVTQGTVEFGQLIDRLIADKGLADEEDSVRIIH